MTGSPDHGHLRPVAKTAPEVAEVAFDDVFHQSAVPQLLLSVNGTITHVNAALQALLVRPPRDLLGGRLIDYLVGPARDRDRERLDALQSGHLDRATFERRVEVGSGEGIDALVSLASIRTASGAVGAICVSLHDVSALRGAQLEAESERARWRSLSENASDVALITNAELVIEYVSPSMTAWLGRGEGQLVGVCLLEVVHEGDRQRLDSAMKLWVLSGVGDGAVEYRIGDAAGQWRDVVQHAVNLLDDPAVAGLVLNLRDETERHALESDLRRAALRDKLTGLANRSLFMDRLDQAIEGQQGCGRRCAVLLIDVDKMRVINESHGHLVGDQVLQAVADRLSALVRPSDTVARYDSDQFAVLIDDVRDHADVAALARQVAANLDIPLRKDDFTVSISASVGVAHGPAASADQLVSAADAAVTAAKASGRASVHVLDPQAHERLNDDRELATDLLAAVAEGQLAVHYQPIVELASGTVVGFEALVRWPHPRLGLLRPDRFLGLASALGVMNDIDDWVLTQACRDLVSWRAAYGAELTVSVNVAPHRLATSEFKGRVEGALAGSGLAPSGLTLEITETAVVADVGAAASALAELSSMGVGIAIDDFGIGYSSMLQLRQLPFDQLKIDREFTRGLPHSSDDVAICASVIGLADRLGVRTTAEGVETPSQAAAVISLGCQYGQGYLWSPAVPSHSVPTLLEAPRWQPGVQALAVSPPELRTLTGDPRVVARARRLHEAGASLNTIAANLNMRGLRTSTGRRWQPATVARLLYN